MRETSSILGRINDAHLRARKAKCQEKGCRLFLPQTSDIVILKGEKLTELPHQNNQPAVCDCFIFDGNDRINVALVELKSASLHEERIRRKFESSARIAKSILRGAGYSAPFNLALILLAKRYSSSQKKNYRELESAAERRGTVFC